MRISILGEIYVTKRKHSDVKWEIEKRHEQEKELLMIRSE